MNQSDRMEQNRRPFFKNLDALRFFAFLGVFIQHTLPSPSGNPSVILSSEVWKLIFSFNYLGVPFFFTLSSFLITYRLLNEQRSTEKVNLMMFYVRRGLRIWPIYFLVLAICFLILPIMSHQFGMSAPTLPSPWSFLFFFANFYMITHGVGFLFALIPLWSISIEEQFYVIWGLMLKVFHQYIYKVIILCFLVSVSFCFYYMHSLLQSRTDLKLHTMYAVLDFCSGALIAVAGFRKDALFRFLRKLPRIFYPIVYISIIIFYVLETSAVINADLIISGIFYSICFALILFDQAFNERRIFNAGKLEVFNYLGKISYGLYIYHELSLTMTMKAFHFFSIGSKYNTLLWQSGITLLITIIIAQLSYHYFEKYFLRLKNNWR